MGVPLKNPPVYFTVAQVKFNTVLKLSEYLPAIQENFRTTDYPDYKSGQVMIIEITADETGKPTPKPRVQETYMFRNIDKTVSFILETDKLTLQSTRYGRFEDFSTKFLHGLSVVHAAVHLDFIDRVGMRYLDRVWPAGHDQLEDYLVPEAKALSRIGGGMPLHSLCEGLNQIGDIKVLSRVLTLSGGLVFPPDMMPGDMAIEPRFQAFTGRHAILDYDGFFEGREPYSEEAIAKHLATIHEHVDQAFRATVTDHARKVWDC